MTDDNKRANVALEMAEAARTREAAERIAGLGEYEAATNRLYFAAMHAVRALCLSEGLEPRSHRGLKRLLALHFTSTGTLPPSLDAGFAQLETERDLVDYGAGYRVTKERYAERRAAADDLLAEVARHLQTSGWLAG